MEALCHHSGRRKEWAKVFDTKEGGVRKWLKLGFLSHQRRWVNVCLPCKRESQNQIQWSKDFPNVGPAISRIGIGLQPRFTHHWTENETEISVWHESLRQLPRTRMEHWQLGRSGQPSRGSINSSVEGGFLSCPWTTLCFVRGRGERLCQSQWRKKSGRKNRNIHTVLL